jgi:hypothetical protein
MASVFVVVFDLSSEANQVSIKRFAVTQPASPDSFQQLGSCSDVTGLKDQGQHEVILALGKMDQLAPHDYLASGQVKEEGTHFKGRISQVTARS